ncbi:hypothetical protein [Amycolatopsis sp. CA-128772]|uniref:hypothetical protein n=1 Tax=Amycolatopsis sp. CA-128772 TaxID=2073159 RepID=UPI001304B7AE|nr:hypothetical protein [Amycolatopsis sp. CA-128772]
MPRRPTPVGAWGEISLADVGPKRYEASARIRLANGESKHVRARGASKAAARDNLKAKLVDMRDEILSEEIGRDTPFGKVAAMWIDDLEVEYRQHGRSPDTIRQWRGYVRNRVIKSLGQLTCAEVEQSVRTCDRLIQRCLEERSYSAAVSICGYRTGRTSARTRGRARRTCAGPPAGDRNTSPCPQTSESTSPSDYWFEWFRVDLSRSGWDLYNRSCPQSTSVNLVRPAIRP